MPTKNEKKKRIEAAVLLAARNAGVPIPTGEMVSEEEPASGPGFHLHRHLVFVPEQVQESRRHVSGSVRSPVKLTKVSLKGARGK